MKLRPNVFTAKTQAGKLKGLRLSNLKIPCLFVSSYFSEKASDEIS